MTFESSSNKIKITGLLCCIWLLVSSVHCVSKDETLQTTKQSDSSQLHVGMAHDKANMIISQMGFQFRWDYCLSFYSIGDVSESRAIESYSHPDRRDLLVVEWGGLADCITRFTFYPHPRQSTEKNNNDHHETCEELEEILNNACGPIDYQKIIDDFENADMDTQSF